jgi:hypothetical protein
VGEIDDGPFARESTEPLRPEEDFGSDDEEGE